MNQSSDIDALFRRMVDQSTAPIALLDEDHRVLFANDAMARLLATTSSDLVGVINSQLVEAATAPEFTNMNSESYVTGKSPRPVVADVLGDQQRHLYELHAVTIGDSDPDRKVIAIFGNDVTRRELAVFSLNVSQRIAKLGSWYWDSSADTVICSQQMLEMVGRDPELGPISSKDVMARCVDADGASKLREFISEALRVKEVVTCEVLVRAARDEQRWFRFSSIPDPMRSGFVYGATQDVTEERQRLEDIMVAQERFRHAFEDGDVAMAMTALDGRILIANRAILRMLGYSREELERLSMNDVLLSADRKLREQIIAEAISGESDSFVVESHIRRGDGVFMWVIRHITVVRNEDGSARELLTQLIDTTEHHSTEEQLRHLAEHDPLTEVLNRRGFDAVLANHIDHDRRAQLDSCLILIDIDDFKSVNDDHGHAAGDRVLVTLARILKEQLRTTDATGRLGGDEFAVLLPETRLDGARVVATQIIADAGRRLVLDGPHKTRNVDISIGIASLADSDRAGISLAEAADRAMYEAKRSAGTSFAVFSDTVDAAEAADADARN